jgi:hypothetical protein
MSWEMVTAIGQLAAVLVGIPSLIYLAAQIREQTKERRQAAVHALTEQWGDLTESLHNNSEMAAIFLRGVRSFVLARSLIVFSMCSRECISLIARVS